MLGKETKRKHSRERAQHVRKQGGAVGNDTLKEVDEVALGKRLRRQGWLKDAAERYSEVYLQMMCLQPFYSIWTLP